MYIHIFFFARLILSKRATFISQINPLSGRYDESHPPDLEEKLQSHRSIWGLTAPKFLEERGSREKQPMKSIN